VKLEDWKVELPKSLGDFSIRQWEIASGYQYLELNFSDRTVHSPKDALLISIMKWRILVKACENKFMLSEGGTRTCGLCHNHFLDSCLNCPVANFTGRIYCKNTQLDQFVAGLNHKAFDVAKLAAESILNVLQTIWRNKYRTAIPNVVIPDFPQE
jgi:hypothetical protein